MGRTEGTGEASKGPWSVRGEGRVGEGSQRRGSERLARV